MDFLDLQSRARAFAVGAHAAVGHMRKYTGEPYAEHLREVVEIMLDVESDWTASAIAAAWLHDVVEDTQVTNDLVRIEFGDNVADAVDFLSDDPTLPEGTPGRLNRAQRKARTVERLRSAPHWVQSIKVADLISNTSSIVQHDPHFASVYLREKATLLGALTRAHPRLIARAQEQLAIAVEVA